MKLNVPYYAQSSEFSCGPACVLMAMKHFDPSIKLSRELEFDVWRKCNMIGVRGADPYGLAVPFLEAGYEVLLVTQRRQIAKFDAWKRRLLRIFSMEEFELSIFGMKENRKRALIRGLRVVYKRPVLADLHRGFKEGFLPIALVHMGVVHSLNIPHWVVVAHADAESVVFNDPYPPKGRKELQLPVAKFQKILDDIDTKIGLSPSILFIKR